MAAARVPMASAVPGRFHVQYFVDDRGNVASSENESLWLAARRTGITATDARKLVRLNGVRSVQWDRLMQAKIYDDETPWSQAFELGIQREPVIALWIEQHFGIEHNTILCRGDSRRHLATPDGIGDGVISEIKVSTKPWQQTASVYRDQIQWQLHVTHSERLLFAVEGRNTRTLQHGWIGRDESRIAMLARHANLFLDELDERLVLLDRDSAASRAGSQRNRVHFVETGSEPEQYVLPYQSHSAESSAERFTPVPKVEKVTWGRTDSHLLLEAYSVGRELVALARMFDVTEADVVAELCRWLLNATGELADDTCENFGKYWTFADEQAVFSQFDQGVELRELARSVGRDQLGVAFRLFSAHKPVVRAQLLRQLSD